jgi:glutathione synthase/RimK-type ligase-like ATP-grasp enzyme
VTVLNDPGYVEEAQCKLTTYRRLEQDGVAIPAYTDDPAVAADWLAEGRFRRVLARSTTRGSQGVGIAVLDSDTQMMPRVPLYVEYVPKKHEYRIHVGRNRNGQYEVLDVQQKRKRREVDNDDVNYQVRNGRHGWVFCRDDITPPSGEAMAQAIAALRSLGLDFGAVDLGVTEKDGRVAVYEVNTAPGLEGTTLEVYSDYIGGRA